MTDRTPTKVLPNGAIRYEVFDEQGNFLGYEYMRPADDPTDVGTPLTKPTFLTDATAAAIGLDSEDPTVNEALAKLRYDTVISAETAAALGIGEYDNPTVDQALLKIATPDVPSSSKSILRQYSGHYIGSGVYGEDNPNSILFPYRPRLLCIIKHGLAYNPVIVGANRTDRPPQWLVTPETIFFVSPTMTGAVNVTAYTFRSYSVEAQYSNDVYSITGQLSNNKFSWYCTSASKNSDILVSAQLNTLNTRYDWTIFA